MSNWIELPVIFVDKSEDEIEKDAELGVKYNESEYQVDWCSFRESEIVAFNQGSKSDTSTIRLMNTESFNIALSYQELKNNIIKNNLENTCVCQK